MINRQVAIPEKIYLAILSLLSTGQVQHDDVHIDFSAVQNISISNGVASFTPSPKIVLKIGFVTLQTTLSSVSVKNDGILVEVDNSPINIELKPL